MIDDYLDTTITISNPIGLDGYGKPIFGESFDAVCRWQPISRLSQKPDSDNVIVAVKIYLPNDITIINNGRVVKDNTNYQVIEVAERSFVGSPSHKEVLLKYEQYKL